MKAYPKLLYLIMLMCLSSPASALEQGEGDFLCKLIRIDYLLKEEGTRWEKPLTFPTTDLIERKAFERGLSFINQIPFGLVTDQCHYSCTSFATAEFYRMIGAAPYNQGVSAAYLAARVFEQKFYIALRTGNRQHLQAGPTLSMLADTAKEHGLLPESLYPSRNDVNTPELEKRLTAVLEQYRHLVVEIGSGAAWALLQKPVQQIIQKFFGEYPTQDALQAAGLASPQDYYKGLLQSRVGSTPLQGSYVDKNLKKLAELALKHKIPLLISYRHESTQLGRDGVYRLASPNELQVPQPHAEVYHAALVIGLAKHTDGKIYYQIKNSHQNAPVLYLAEDYLMRHAMTYRGYYILPINLLNQVDWLSDPFF